MCKEEFYMMKRNKRVFVLSLAVFIFLIGIWETGVTAKETEKLIGAGTTKAFRLLRELCDEGKLETQGNGRLSYYVSTISK